MNTLSLAFFTAGDLNSRDLLFFNDFSCFFCDDLGDYDCKVGEGDLCGDLLFSFGYRATVVPVVSKR